MIHLQNEELTAIVKEKGAELGSLKSNATGIEYLWQADPKYWARHAPVLFPIVGQVKDGKYEYRGAVYELPQHGFARDQEFEVTEQSQDRVRLRLKSSDETLAKYPAAFELLLTYELVASQVNCTYDVFNTGADDMHFSLGLHPGFTCPMVEGTSFEDYELVFSEKETLDRHLLDGPLLSGEVEPHYLQDEASIPLHHELFKDDALVFEGIKSQNIRLQSTKTEHYVEMGLAGFPFLGIWSKPNSKAPFVCIEPWYGVADEMNRKPFIEKKGIQVLEGRGKWKAQTYIKVK